MLPNISGVSEASRDSGSSEAVHDYAEIYTPSREGMNWLQGGGQGPRPPTPPLHRFPSWEAKIYQVTFNLCSKTYAGGNRKDYISALKFRNNIVNISFLYICFLYFVYFHVNF